jgi:protein-tyrosine phosphatase
MAEFILKDMVTKRHIEDKFYIASAATSTEEIWNGAGNPVYPPAKQELAKHGITCAGKCAVHLQRSDYREYDYIIGMDRANIRNMLRIFGGDPDNKVSMLMKHAGIDREVTDPWYTGRFDIAYQDILHGCKAFLNTICTDIK